VKRVGLVLAAVTIAAGAVALWLFPRAIPIVALEQRMTRALALQRADSFFRAHALAPAGARRAVRFRSDDSLRTFVELAAGGKDTLDALVRGRDVAPFTWSVRAFVPGDPHEASVDFAPDGRLTGFRRTFAEADVKPTLSSDSARVLAEQVLGAWVGEGGPRWRLATSSYETRKTSGRVDRTYTFERTGRKVGDAPLRLDVVIAGDAPSAARPYVVIPEAFSRRYGEMRSANEFLTLLATVGVLVFAIAGAVALRRYARAREVRWREPIVVGGVIAALFVAAQLNVIPTSWYDYDTATSPALFETMQLAAAILVGVSAGALVALTLAAAEALTRAAFPRHLDWWKLWRIRGTREVAGRVAGGYAVAAIGFAWVALFYVVTREAFGWWVPSELLDDPNQIATPMPWLAGIAISLQAGVWEEALFRALPLSLLSLWVGNRPHRTAWMAAGIAVAALVFGFAHASYPSWPPYSRGVEIFLDACFWGVLFLSFGLIVTVVAHFVYDLVLFGLFAATGTAVEYRVSAAIILLALLAPALAVAWRWVRQRGLTLAGDDARFAAWAPTPRVEVAVPAAEPATRMLGARARKAAMVTVAVGVLVALLAPDRPVLGPRFTGTRARVAASADSTLAARGVDPSAWKRLQRTATDTLDAWPRFLREHRTPGLAAELAPTYAVPAWWVVRYVRLTGPLAERAEEWRVRFRPDGSPLDVRHILPESARRESPGAPETRRLARAALARAGLDTTRLIEAHFEETARPARRDVTVTYTDSTLKLPGEAAARAWVSLAGDEPLVVRRGVELPERFLRADRDAEQRRLVISVLAGVVLLAAVVGGAIFVTRRRQVLVQDATPGRRAVVIALAALALVQIAESLDALPAQLYLYDTATPWSTFVSTTGISIVLGGVLLPLVLYGLWLALNALRRRVGIPLLPDAAPSARVPDALLAGVALGALPMLLARASSLAMTGEIPGAPDTMLAQAVPALAEALAVPTSVVAMVPFLAIPALVIAGVSRRGGVRAALALAFLVLLAGIGATAAERFTAPSPGTVAVALIAPVAIFLAVRAWGSLCAWSWIVAALVERALSDMNLALHAPTPAEHAAGAIGVTVSLALLAWLVRVSARASPRATGSA